MVLKMKVEAVNFWKSKEISLLWLDCFITEFRNKRRGGANRSPPGPNRVKQARNLSILQWKWSKIKFNA